MADVVPFVGDEDCRAAADWLVRAFGFAEVERQYRAEDLEGHRWMFGRRP